MTLSELTYKLENIWKDKKNVVIVSHFKPDGDAVGSSMGLKHFLSSISIGATVVLPDHMPLSVEYLDPDGSIVFYSSDKNKAQRAIASADLIVCVDFNKLSRTEWLGDHIAASSAAKVMIDHHPLPETEGFDLVISDPKASSTCELLLRIMLCTGAVDHDIHKIVPESLQALATGLVTDTNNFNNSISPETFIIASKLVEAGVDFEDINNRVFKCFSEDRMRLMGYLLSESMQVDHARHTSCMILTMNDRDRFNFRDGDSEGLVNLPLSIADVEISALFTETPDFIRVSLRSKGRISVNDLSRAFFNGGGHYKAAGGRLYMPIGQVREYFRESVEQFLQKQ